MGSHVSRESATAKPSDDRAATAVMVALRRIVRYLRLADREAEAALGLSAAQLFVLHALGETTAPSLVELARRTLTDPSSVSTVVDRLVTRRLVRRTRARTDARRAELRLTAAGERVVRSAPRAPQVMIVAKLRAMPAPRRAALVRSLDELVRLLGATELAPRMMFEDDAGDPPPARRPRRER